MKFTFDIKDNLHTDLKIHAAQKKITMAEVAETAIEKYLHSNEKADKKKGENGKL